MTQALARGPDQRRGPASDCPTHWRSSPDRTAPLWQWLASNGMFEAAGQGPELWTAPDSGARCQGGKGPLLGAVRRSAENLAGCQGDKRARPEGRVTRRGVGWSPTRRRASPDDRRRRSTTGEARRLRSGPSPLCGAEARRGGRARSRPLVRPSDGSPKRLGGSLLNMKQ